MWELGAGRGDALEQEDPQPTDQIFSRLWGVSEVSTPNLLMCTGEAGWVSAGCLVQALCALLPPSQELHLQGLAHCPRDLPGDWEGQ